MRVCLAVFFTLVTIVITQTQFGHAGRSGPWGVRGDPGIVGAPGEVGPPGPVGKKGTPQVKYCSVSSKITTFLRQFRVKGRDGATGRMGRTKRQTSATSWIYQGVCLHAGLNFQKNRFEVRTEHCCEKCRFPNFWRCMRKVSGSERHSRCHSEAIRCIASCINTNGRQPGRPGPTAGRPGPTGGRPGRPGPQECPATRKKVGNSYCLERSCIPV